jgi:hypothetical protein
MVGMNPFRVLALTGLLALSSSAQTAGKSEHHDWRLVRSVPNGFGGTLDLVLIPEVKQRDRQYYMRVSDIVCGSKTRCMVMFWTDRRSIPNVEDAWIPVENLAVMTANYERSPKYKEPSLSLACWLYPSKSIGEVDKCAYSPGAKVPPEK